MNRHSGSSRSFWMGTARIAEGKPLAGDHVADVCVVGAGIAGLTTALALQRSGRKVLVLDDGPVAGGETERTTAHLSAVLGARYTELERLHGESGARVAAASHAAAIAWIEAMASEIGGACEFERLDGYLVPPGGDPGVLDLELAAVHRAGLTGVESSLRFQFATFDTGPALRFPTRPRSIHCTTWPDWRPPSGRPAARSAPAPTSPPSRTGFLRVSWPRERSERPPSSSRRTAP